MKAADMDPIASHLRDTGQREEIARLGMWLFLSTEVLFFGGMFLGFAIYRVSYAEAFVAASGRLNVWLGSTNTLVLLTSSLFVAFAVLAARTGDRKGVTHNLIITLLLALLFLSVKGIEYHQEFHEHLVPGWNFSLPGVDPTSAARQQLFFCFYFLMTGLHAVHMLIGCGVMTWLVCRERLGHGSLSDTERIRVESLALYWHFVDFVWIFLLPLLYLNGLE